jgi:hypothetical protein
MMNKPKLPDDGNLLPPARCSICGQEVKLGEEYEASKRARYGNVYAHTDCLRRKGADSHDTAGERPGG